MNDNCETRTRILARHFIDVLRVLQPWAVLLLEAGKRKTERRSGLVTHRLAPIATVPVCAPSWLANGAIDFSKVPLLHARPRLEDWRRWLDHVGLKRVTGLSGNSFESLGLAIEAAAAGAGIAMAIEGLLAADLAHGRLVRAHQTTRPTRRYFVLQYEARLADDPALKTFAAVTLSSSNGPKRKRLSNPLTNDPNEHFRLPPEQRSASHAGTNNHV